VSDRLVELLLLLEHRRKGVPRLQVARVAGNLGAQGGFGLVDPALPQVDVAERRVGLRYVGLGRQRRVRWAIALS